MQRGRRKLWRADDQSRCRRDRDRERDKTLGDRLAIDMQSGLNADVEPQPQALESPIGGRVETGGDLDTLGLGVYWDAVYCTGQAKALLQKCYARLALAIALLKALLPDVTLLIEQKHARIGHAPMLVEWMYRYGDLRLGDTVLVQGPGQQGLSAVLTAKEAGAACIIATGLSRDAHRLALARQLGADHTIDVETENLREKVLDVTGGKGVNVVVNVTGGGRTTVADSIAVAAKLRCTIVLAAAGQEEINVGTLGRAKIVLKRANGHSYFAVEQAIRLIASGKYPLSELCTHSYGLADVGLAIRTVAGDGVPGGIHVSVLPWREA
jgi:NADPH:quinone reductase-like Zn-dependent oxidoreductase